MGKLEDFYELIKKDEVLTLATAADGSVTMRVVSPAYYNGAVLIFTDPSSLKYSQLKANPNCCLSIGGIFAEASAEFFGATMLESNTELRKVYSEKFQGAFDGGIENGGENAEFIVLKPFKITGWTFENDIPTEDGIPTMPFEICID